MFSPSVPVKDRRIWEEAEAAGRRGNRRHAGILVSFRDLDNDVGD